MPQVEYGFKLESQVEKLICWESDNSIIGKPKTFKQLLSDEGLLKAGHQILERESLVCPLCDVPLSENLI